MVVVTLNAQSAFALPVQDDTFEYNENTFESAQLHISMSFFCPHKAKHNC
jgi:hypothetical protein